MLDMAKVAAAIQGSEAEIWVDMSDAYRLLIATWDALIKDPLFAYRVASVPSPPWALPSWHEPLANTVPVTPFRQAYTIISTDGSQIFPDRHYGVSCGLINIGTVTIPYHNDGLGVVLENDPILVLPDAYAEEISPHDFITLKRQEYEFQYAVAAAQRIAEMQPAVLFDGSLIFWHLQAIPGYEVWVNRYTNFLLELERMRIPYSSYISAPKSKDLLNLARLQLCNFNLTNQAAYAPIAPCTDATIMAHHLPVGYRSIFFRSNASVTNVYPPSQRPYFCYLHHETEIGRLELPAWLVHDAALRDYFISIVWDQLEKGEGYPIALAEAHEQAVVKGPDRQLFFVLLENASTRKNHSYVLSRKQLLKDIPRI